MYLEEVLKRYDNTTNVCVKLASVTYYGEGEIENPIPMIDGCGNHYAKNWRTAIDRCSQLKNKFNVISTVTDNNAYPENFGSKRTLVTIHLENKKDYYSNMLAVESNQAAIDDSFCHR